MGSQYIRGTTIRNIRNKKHKRVFQTQSGDDFRYFTMIYEVIISEKGKFFTEFSTFPQEG